MGRERYCEKIIIGFFLLLIFDPGFRIDKKGGLISDRRVICDLLDEHL
jgi:hypothetical protein